MSPKTNSRTIKKAIWIVVILTILGGGSTFAYLQWFAPTDTLTDTSQSEMQTSTVRQGDLIIYATGTGTLISASEATFGFNSSGQITNIYVKVGDKVESGDVLAEIDDTNAKSAYQDALRSLNEIISPSAIASAKQAVAEAELAQKDAREYLAYMISPSVLTWEERFAEAQRTLEDAKAEGDADKITAAEASVSTAEVNLKYAQNNYSIYVEESFTETETDQRTGEVSIVWYYDENGNRYKNVMTPTDLDISEARAAYELANATLQEDQWYLAALQGEETPENATGSQLISLEKTLASIDDAQASLEATQLVAPISGTVMSLDVSVGDQVGTSSIITIADLSTPYLEVYLDETDWSNVAVDYPVEVTFDALPDKTYTGVVTQVDPGLVSQQGASLVRILVRLDSNQSGLNLPIGAAAAVDVIGGRAENATLVPVEALREISSGEYAVFVLENGEPVMRMVEIGIKDIFYAEVKSGLQDGDVVTTGIVETGE